ncbi:MAG: MarR family winged helix-turn-helix transcriptional regulator [Caulobacteraceae bacterium]
MGKPDPSSPAGRRAEVVTDFEASASYLICAIGNKIGVVATRNLRKLVGLSLMEWRVLAILAAEPGATPGRVIAFTGVNKSVVSRAVNLLLNKGLVAREAAPDHGLRTHLHLTEAGHVVHDRGIGSRLSAEEQLLSHLSPADRERLVQTLKQLTQNLDKA